MRRVDFNLYLISSGKAADDEPLITTIEAALKGGAKAVQLREKKLSAKKLFGVAKKLRELTNLYNAKLFINDRIDVALAVKADGTHLGQASFSAQEARGLTGSEMLIGVSTHSMDEALKAEADGADFITLGPIYETPSKLCYGKPIGASALNEVSKKIAIPIFALGGVKKDNINELITNGADGVALISAVMSSKDPRASTMTIIQELNNTS